jgi:hypothetical protein
MYSLSRGEGRSKREGFPITPKKSFPRISSASLGSIPGVQARPRLLPDLCMVDLKISFVEVHTV